jgi:hypothetical protein
MDKMKDFYRVTLEMDLIVESETLFSVMAGTTKLTFEKSESVPYYHLAFRMGNDYFEKVYEKLASEDILLEDENGETKLYWKGKQAYFIDPDGNILELLERPFVHGCQEPKGWFDVCEIGIPSNDVKAMQQELSQYIKDEVNGQNETFAFYGDTQGHFVLVKEGRHWYPTDRGAEVHPLKITIVGDSDKTFVHPNYPYEIIIRKEWDR